MTGEDIYYTSQDGLRLFAKSYGPNDALLTALCMHGLTRNHKDFEPMISAISALDSPCRFISVDVRGRGQSAWDEAPANYAPMKYAEDMIALLDELKLEKVVLIGTSMGGVMAMFLMAMIPDRILGVIINDVGPVVEQAGLRRISSYATAPKPVENWEAAARTVAVSQACVYPDNVEADWMAFAKRTYRENADGTVITDYDPAIMNSFSAKRPGFLVRMAAWKMFAAMNSCPLLIIRGEMSDVLGKATAKRMVKRHKSARLVTIPKIGHTPMLDEPDAVQAINTFLGAL